MIKCIKYRPINKGNCLGSVDIEVGKWKLQMFNLTLHQKDGRRWINPPSRKYEDKETGETKYAWCWKFPDPNDYKVFCEKVKEAVDEHAKETANPQAEEEVPF